MGLVLRRLRGLAFSMILWSVPWAAFGALIGGVVLLSASPITVFAGARIPGGVPVALALLGSLVGAVNGLVFALLLMLGERKRAFTELRAPRVGLWAALATAGTVYLGFPSFIVAGIAATCGFLGGAVALRLARHSDTVATNSPRWRPNGRL